MAELATIARPYAAAAFNYAKQRGQLAQWSDTLSFLVAILNDARVQAALNNPELTRAGVESTLIGLAGEKIDGAARNFLSLLVRNDRLDTLAAVREQYEQLKAEHENEVEAKIASAFPMNDDQLRNVVQRLEQRTHRKVKAEVTLAPELIGGVRIQIGDDVWDGSVRGQLENLAAALTR